MRAADAAKMTGLRKGPNHEKILVSTARLEAYLAAH
jgi:hypothetical protein